MSLLQERASSLLQAIDEAVEDKIKGAARIIQADTLSGQCEALEQFMIGILQSAMTRSKCSWRQAWNPAAP